MISGCRTLKVNYFKNPKEVGDYYVEDQLCESPENEKLRKYGDYLTENYTFNESVLQPKLWAAKNHHN